MLAEQLAKATIHQKIGNLPTLLDIATLEFCSATASYLQFYILVNFSFTSTKRKMLKFPLFRLVLRFNVIRSLVRNSYRRESCIVFLLFNWHFDFELIALDKCWRFSQKCLSFWQFHWLKVIKLDNRNT